MNPTPFPILNFVKSASNMKELPPDIDIEIAMMGRSNAGKSSALNAIAQQKKLARTSKTPGRTQLINFFNTKDNQILIDLPGYGYAKVPCQQKDKLEKMLNDYIAKRQSLIGVFLVMDIRHPLKSQDQQIIQYCIDNNLLVHILLSKADKISKSNQIKTRTMLLNNVTNKLVSAQLFSVPNRQGIIEAQNVMLKWWQKK